MTYTYAKFRENPLADFCWNTNLLLKTTSIIYSLLSGTNWVQKISS